MRQPGCHFRLFVRVNIYAVAGLAAFVNAADHFHCLVCAFHGDKHLFAGGKAFIEVVDLVAVVHAPVGFHVAVTEIFVRTVGFQNSAVVQADLCTVGF